MPVSSAACWCLAGCFWTAAGVNWGTWLCHKLGDQFVSPYRSTPPNHQQVSPAQKTHQNQTKQRNEGKNKSSSGILWLTKLWEKQSCASGGTDPQRNTPNGNHLLEVRWSRFSSTSLPFSSCQNLSCVALWGSGRLCSVFPGAFLVFSYSARTAKVVFYLVALIARPSSLSPLFLRTGNRSSVLLKVVSLWFCGLYPVLSSEGKRELPLFEYFQHLITINILELTALLLIRVLSSSVMSSVDLWPLRLRLPFVDVPAAFLKAFSSFASQALLWSLQAHRRRFQIFFPAQACKSWARLVFAELLSQLQSVFCFLMEVFFFLQASRIPYGVAVEQIAEFLETTLELFHY